MSAANSIVRSKVFKDDRLDIDQIDHYSLSFFISATTIQITVFDEKKKRLLLYERYQCNGLSTVETLDEIYHDHILISAGFWQTVRVSIDSNQFCIVPSSLFSFEHQFDYIKLNSRTDPNNDAYRSVTHDHLDIAFVFAIKKTVIKWFSDKYFNLEVRHSHIGLNFLQMTYNQLSKKDGERVFINLGDEEMQIAGLNNGKLAIYNQFPIGSHEQQVKYVLLTIKQFSDSGQAADITLWGSKKSMTQFKVLFTKYFKNLTIGTRPKIKISPQFNEFESFELIDVLSVYG